MQPKQPLKVAAEVEPLVAVAELASPLVSNEKIPKTNAIRN